MRAFPEWRKAEALLHYQGCSTAWAIHLKIFLIKVWLNYYIVLIMALQQSDSVIHRYTVFFISFSITVYHRIFNIVPMLYSRTLLFQAIHFFFLKIIVLKKYMFIVWLCQLGHTGSLVVVCKLSCLVACGIEPVSPAL